VCLFWFMCYTYSFDRAHTQRLCSPLYSDTQKWALALMGQIIYWLTSKKTKVDNTKYACVSSLQWKRSSLPFGGTSSYIYHLPYDMVLCYVLLYLIWKFGESLHEKMVFMVWSEYYFYIMLLPGRFFLYMNLPVVGNWNITHPTNTI